MFSFRILLSILLFIFVNTTFSSENHQDICTPTGNDNATFHKLILMDAGSSGVRIMAYCFEKAAGIPVFDLKYQTPLLESHQKLESNLPLPKEFSAFLKEHHPEALPAQKIDRFFFLGATAGLRSVDGKEAKTILMKKSDEISESGYNTEYNRNVRLLSGLEEGSYTWFGVNYIMQSGSNSQTALNSIKSMAFEQESQFGIIEMGGGSVQVAFRIPHKLKHQGLKRDTDPDLIRSEEANIKTLRLLGEYELEVFANSQPYKGLNFAYNDLVNKYLTNPAANPCLVKGTPVNENGVTLYSYGNYDDCAEAINSTVFKTLHASFDDSRGTAAESQAIFDQTYKDLLPEKFFLTGYFFDRTTAMGFPEIFTPKYLETAARYICNLDYSTLGLYYFARAALTVSPEMRYIKYLKLRDIFLQERLSQGGVPRTGDLEKHCAHLTYMSLILKKIGLSPDHTLYTQKSLFYRGKGYGVSWPLGYALLSINGWE